ncbi:MAG: DUF3299 domain-containing protein, partial [Bacteroidota bacterium]
MKYLGILLVIFSFSTYTLKAQVDVSWMQLERIEYELRDESGSGFSLPIPKFSNEIKNLEGKKVRVKGYVIPLNIEGTEYAISAYPNASCFFCGSAGQESVMRLTLKDKRVKYNVDEFLEFEGELQLNYLPDDLMYALEG